MLFVSLTGVLLNHADDFSLNEKQVSSPWLLNRYGMGLEGEPVSFVVNGHIVTDWGGNTFLDGVALGLSGEIVGAIEAGDGIGIFCTDVIHLVDAEGALFESLDEGVLPEGRIEAVAKVGHAIRMEAGDRWHFSDDYLEFDVIEKGAEISNWSSSVQTPKALRGEIEKSYHGGGLPWSRLLLDLHSGRFFGSIGRWVVDSCVVLLVFLSITGLRLGLRNRRGKSS
ncbi:MAG: hypothetical protein ACI9R3_005906 [Verrucomicrobiales bacterium]|jgi:hypothetical protein